MSSSRPEQAEDPGSPSKRTGLRRSARATAPSGDDGRLAALQRMIVSLQRENALLRDQLRQQTMSELIGRIDALDERVRLIQELALGPGGRTPLRLPDDPPALPEHARGTRSVARAGHALNGAESALEGEGGDLRSAVLSAIGETTAERISPVPYDSVAAEPDVSAVAREAYWSQPRTDHPAPWRRLDAPSRAPAPRGRTRRRRRKRLSIMRSPGMLSLAPQPLGGGPSLAPQPIPRAAIRPPADPAHAERTQVPAAAMLPRVELPYRRASTSPGNTTLRMPTTLTSIASAALRRTSRRPSPQAPGHRSVEPAPEQRRYSGRRGGASWTIEVGSAPPDPARADDLVPGRRRPRRPLAALALAALAAAAWGLTTGDYPGGAGEQGQKPVADALPAPTVPRDAATSTHETPAATPRPRAELPDRAITGLSLTKAALAHLRQGKNHRALEHATRAVAVDPANAEAWIVLGAARQALRDEAGAREAFAHCAQLGEDDDGNAHARECRRLLQ